MMNSFHVSATSMHAHQTHVDVIANNLANVSTTGFKKSKVEFADMVYREMTQNNQGLLRPGLLNPVGLGATAGNVEKIFTTGDFRETGRNLDIGIRGNGFLEVLMPDGDHAYTRTGFLQVDKEGMLTTTDGYSLSPSVRIPPDALDVVIAGDGTVSVLLPDSQRPVEVGYIELAGFMNPGGLTPMGNNLYKPSEESGDVFYGQPGDEQMGQIAQGFLEGSNVDMIDELTALMMAQRGYEMNAKVIQAADEMLGIVNGLRR